MHRLQDVDIAVLALYFLVVVMVGSFLARRSKTLAHFTTWSATISSCAVVLSLFGTSHANTINLNGALGIFLTGMRKSRLRTTERR
jgi:hypothetical protein